MTLVASISVAIPSKVFAEIVVAEIEKASPHARDLVTADVARGEACREDRRHQFFASDFAVAGQR
jgi:hypothetical protein